MGPPAPARRCEARWPTRVLAGLADLQHALAEAVDRKLGRNLQVWVSGCRHVGETVRIDDEVSVVAAADAFAVPEHREVASSVDVLDHAADSCLLTISDVEDDLPPTHEEVGLARWSIGHLANVHLFSPAQLISTGSISSAGSKGRSAARCSHREIVIPGG